MWYPVYHDRMLSLCYSSCCKQLSQPEQTAVLAAGDIAKEDVYSKGLTLAGNKYFFTSRDETTLAQRISAVSVMVRKGVRYCVIAPNKLLIRSILSLLEQWGCRCKDRSVHVRWRVRCPSGCCRCAHFRWRCCYKSSWRPRSSILDQHTLYIR